MQFLFFTLNFFLIAIETIGLVLLASGFFKPRHSLKARFFIVLSYIVLDNLFLVFLGHIVVLKYIWAVFLAVCWLWLSRRANILKSFFTVLLWLSIITVVDSLFLASSSFFALDSSLSIVSDPNAYYLLCYGAKTFELLTVVAIHTWAKNHFQHQHTTWLDWLRVLFFPIATFAATIALVRILFMEPHLASQLFVCIFILLLADLMAILLLNYLEQQRQTALENTVLRQNLKLETEHIEALKDAYAEQRKQTHDFQNQLAVLQGLANRSASQQEFAAYLEKTLSITFPATIYVNTNRLVIDVILSQKYSAAKSKGITFRTALSDLSDFPIPDDALVVILTNLIDNAMDACEKLPTGQRSILLKMQNTDDCALIYIENPTLYPVKIRNNFVMTTKSNPIAHGYGLKNVCTLLKQYDADYAIDYNPTTSAFCFSAQITY